MVCPNDSKGIFDAEIWAFLIGLQSLISVQPQYRNIGPTVVGENWGAQRSALTRNLLDGVVAVRDEAGSG